jgi:PAS domain S-box-containing protein
LTCIRDHLRHDDESVHPDATLQQALDTMVQAGSRHVFLVDDGAPVGVLTERDVLRLYADGADPDTPVGSIGRRAVIRAEGSRPVRYALGLMVDHGIRRVAVVDEAGEWVGGVSHEDLLFAYEAELEPTAITVRELATSSNRALTLPPTASLGEALRTMQAADRGSLLMVQDDVVIGIVTESDVLRLAQRKVDRAVDLAEVAHRPVRAVRPDLAMRELITFMREGRLRHAVTSLEGGELHIISSRDVLNNVRGHYGAFLELRLRDLRATLDDLDTPVVELVRLGDQELVSWRNLAATSELDAEIDASVDSLFEPEAWASLRAQLSASGHAELAKMPREGRTWKVVLSMRRLGEYDVIKAVLTDVSDLTRTAQRLRQHAAEATSETHAARALFSQVFASAPSGMALVARSGEVLLANAELGRLHRVHKDALTGRRLDQVVLAEDGDHAQAAWQQLWGTPGVPTVGLRLRLQTEDDSLQWVEINARRGDGQHLGQAFAICTLVDINARRAATERLEAERARANHLAETLRERQAHTSAILQQAAVGIATLTPEAQVLDTNPAVCNMFGLTAEEFRKRTAYDVMHPEEVDRARSQHGDLHTGARGSVSAERRYLRADGSLFWGNTAITPITSEFGERTGIVAVIQDVTERKRAERRTRELAELLERTVTEIYIVEPDDLHFVHANRAACESLGYRLDELQARTPADVLAHPEHALRARFRTLLDGPEGGCVFLQTEHIRADGSRYPIQAHISLVQYGGRQHILGVIVDATEEVRAQRALLRQNMHFESAQRVAGVGSWELDAETNVLRWSAEMYRMLEQNPADFLPTRDRFLTLMPAAEARRVAAAMDETLAGGEPTDLRIQTDVDGQLRDLRLHAEAVRGAGGATTGLLGTCLDITRLADAERALREQTRWLEEAQRIAQVGSWQWDVADNQLRWSPETYRIYGVDPATFTPTYEGFFTLLDAATQADVAETMATAAEAGDRIDFRHEMVVHGDVRVMHQHGRIIRDADGAVVQHVGTVNDITDEIRRGQELDRQRRHLENAQRVGGVGSWEWDPERGTRHWSDETRKIFGLEPGAGLPSYEEHAGHVHPGDKAALREAVSRCLETGEGVDLEYRYQVRGQWRIVQEFARMLDLQDGSRRMVGTTRDVTDRRSAEKELHDRSLHLEQAQRLANVGSWDLDIRTSQLLWSAEAYRIFGREAGQGPPDLSELRATIHPDDRPTADAALQRAIDGGIPYDLEHRIVVDGDIRFIHQHGEVARGSDGQPARILGTTHDITDHKRTEARLSRALKETIGTISRTFAMRDPYTDAHQKRVADLAVAIGRRMGLSSDELETLHLGSLVHDIGKISVPAELLTIPRRLTKLEYQLIQTHSNQGWEILRDVDLPWPLDGIVRMHHERLDGTGYPLGLKGDEIPPLVRIVSVADVTEAMASHRPYRAGLGVPAALDELRKGKGKAYDADVVAHTLGLFGEDGYVLPAQ